MLLGRIGLADQQELHWFLLFRQQSCHTTQNPRIGYPCQVMGFGCHYYEIRTGGVVDLLAGVFGMRNDAPSA